MTDSDLPSRKSKLTRSASRDLTRPEHMQELLGEYIITALYARMLEEFGGNKRMQKAFFAQAKEAILQGVRILSPDEFSSEQVGDVSGKVYFTQKHPMSGILAAFPAGHRAKKRDISSMIEEKSLNPAMSAVVFLDKPNPIELQFPMSLHEDADARRVKHQQQAEEIDAKVRRARTQSEREEAMIERGIHEQFNWDTTTHVRNFSLTHAVQDAFADIGLKPGNMVQFSKPNRSGVINVVSGGVSKHGYVIDLSDAGLRERIAEKTAELVTHICALESRKIDGTYTNAEARRRITGGKKAIE